MRTTAWLARDAAAGWGAGVLFAALAPMLGALYGVSPLLLVGLALVNAAYGAAGLSMLARVACGEMAAPQALGRIAAANLVWAALCAPASAAALWSGLPLLAAHLFVEGAVVGALGLYERRMIQRGTR